MIAFGAAATDAPARVDASVELVASSAPDGAGTLLAPPEFALLDVRIGVAPENAPAAPGATSLARDHWVLEADVSRDAPGLAARAHLEWNGAARGSVAVVGTLATLRFDLGAQLERDVAYRLTILAP